MTHQFDVIVEKDSAGYFVAGFEVLRVKGSHHFSSSS